jgi:hypothetical protein
MTHQQRAVLYLGRELLRRYRECQATVNARREQDLHWQARQLYHLYCAMVRMFWARDPRYDPFWRGGERSCDM